MAGIRMGTCSWKYPSWEGLVYSQRQGINYLEEYARQFPTVEIDQWFWSLFAGSPLRLPNPFDVESYAASVPADFRFTVKVPNSLTLTHYYRKKKDDPLQPNPSFLSRELFESFLETLKPLQDRLGALIFQFEYLNRQKMPSLEAFLEALERFLAPSDRRAPIGLEVRNPNYLNRTYFDFLTLHALGPVFLQGYYMPPVEEVIAAAFPQGRPPQPEVPVVVRLLGPERRSMEERSEGDWNRILSARDEELERIALAILHLASQANDLYINVNNHYEGSAPLTIRRLQEVIARVTT
jgi:uncharacterized protein YecE (DUF72 family)